MGEVQNLGELAAAANVEHRKVEAAANAALSHALRAGELLLRAKEGVAHGSWGAWLAQNFEGSDRAARVYMQVAKRRDELEAKRQATAETMTLDGALKFLSTAKPEVPQQRDELMRAAEPAAGACRRVSIREFRERVRELNSEPVEEEAGGGGEDRLFPPPPEGYGHPAIERYPQLAFHRIGYASNLHLDTMAANLDAMTEDERERIFDEIARHNPGTLARLAGLPYYDGDDETVPTHVSLELCSHCGGSGWIKLVHDEIGEQL